MMKDDEMLEAISACFAPTAKPTWESLTRTGTWSAFLDALRRIVQDDACLGVEPCARQWKTQRCPLQEFLSVGEVNALFCPPTYAEKRAFAASHFTGGLPESAMPIESLYEPYSLVKTTPFSQVNGLYEGDAASYMRALTKRLGLDDLLTKQAYPDHLSLELELAAYLVRAGQTSQAQLFLSERLAWLTEYRKSLLELGATAGFYIGLVDVLLCIWSHLDVMEESA